MALAPAYLTSQVNTTLGNFGVQYVEAGEPCNPTVLLLHGYPTSATTQFRDLIPLLAVSYHILAPDLPGFGFTTSPDSFKYTFDNLAAVIIEWVKTLQLKNFSIYVFDYGAPVGWRLSLALPDQISAIISQNGNAYEEGFGQEFWQPVFNLWNSSNGVAERKIVQENVLTLEGTKYQYEAGVPEADLKLINPFTYTFDYLKNLAGLAEQERQTDLFYDYRTNVAMYPEVHEWFRKTQVPLLAVWGKGDPAFIPPGAEAFKKDLPHAIVRFVDSGHFALETKVHEIAAAVKDFLGAQRL
jgi:pimeloyl-ACP methyl ester carboxylesterase